jgi:hypothetical protein
VKFEYKEPSSENRFNGLQIIINLDIIIKEVIKMSLHSYSKMWVHLIWSTHNKEKVFSEKNRKLISDFLYKYAEAKAIYI